MDTNRPIDEASRPDEVIYFALTQPLDHSDEVRDVLWDHRAAVLAEFEPTSRAEVLSRRSGSDLLSGPYGFIGPYGIFSLMMALVIGYFTVNFTLFLFTFLACFAGCTFGFIRTTPRWTPARLRTHELRPACSGRLAAWLCTQNVGADLDETILDGALDSTDYYLDLVVIVLDEHPKLSERLSEVALHKDPLAHSWLWRYAPTIDLVERVVALELSTEDHGAHLAALFAALGTDDVADLIPEEGVARTVYDALIEQPPASVPRLSAAEAVTQLPESTPDPDFASLEKADDLAALHVLDLWRRHPQASHVAAADRCLRASIARKTGVHAPAGKSVEALLDRLLFPLVEDQHDTITDAFFTRRERDMISQRRIPLDTFAAHFCHDVHRHVLWGTYLGKNLRDTFRIDETYNLLSIDDDPLDWEPHVTVGVVHPMELTEKKRDQWQLVFAEYDLHGFDQLSRMTYVAPEGNLFEIDALPDPFVLGRLGWTTRETFEEGEGRLSREFAWNGNAEKGVIEFDEEGASLAFWSFDGPMSVLLKRPLADVHPIIMSEALYALHLSTAG